MKRRELIGSAAAGVVASLAAVGAFWWLAKYSLLNERDIVGTTVVVWCVVVARVLIWFEKRERMEKTR